MESKKNNEILYIIIPAYNEEENIGNVINEWYPIIKNYNGNGLSKLVIIDDGSKDNTCEIVQEYINEGTRPLLQLLKKSNSGHGATILFGYRYAIDNHADYIFQTDSDGQTLAEEFERLWKIRTKFDMVIGYRNKRQDGISRIFVTKTLKYAIRLCFGVTVTDANCPYRVMKCSVLKDNLYIIPKDYNLTNVIISVIYAKKGMSVKYIPITFKSRQGGGKFY